MRKQRGNLLLLKFGAVLCVGARRLCGRRRQPPSSFRVEALIEILRRRTRTAERLGAREFRRRETAIPVSSEVRDRLIYAEREVGGVAAEEIKPRHRESAGTVFYLHGGGYNVCSPATHRNLTSRLTLECGGRSVVLDYRLAPDHPHPAALEDALAAYRVLLNEEKSERIMIAGDSAGGGLTLATLVALRDAGDPLPAGAALLSPWVDLTLEQESVRENEPSDYLNRRILETYVEGYCGGLDPRLPAISPLFAELGGLPPLLIHVGGVETLLGEGLALAERARGADVEVELEIWEGAFHVHQAFAPIVPSSSDAIRRIGAFARRRWQEPALR